MTPALEKKPNAFVGESKTKDPDKKNGREKQLNNTHDSTGGLGRGKTMIETGHVHGTLCGRGAHMINAAVVRL